MEALTQPSDWALYLTPRPDTPHQFDVGVRAVGTVFKHRARRINAVAHTKNKQALNFTRRLRGGPHLARRTFCSGSSVHKLMSTGRMLGADGVCPSIP